MIVPDAAPQALLGQLEARRRRQQLHYETLERYATGNHPLPESSEKWRNYYKRWQRRSRTNYCGLAAASVAERLRIQGFRHDDEIEPQIRGWWQTNRLDHGADQVHAAAAEFGDTYVSVGRGDDGQPRIRPESPLQVTCLTSPADSSTVLAGLKTWSDHTTNPRAPMTVGELYLPDQVIPLAPGSGSALGELDLASARPHAMGRVPLVRFVNRARLDGSGLAEFEDAIDIQDRINSLTLHLLSISQAQAFRQRWVKGLDLTDEEGKEIDPPFEAVVSALWAVEDTNVEFGEFDQVDLKPLSEAIKNSVEGFVTLTGLPPHYVAGDLVNASADALAAAEARLVSKVRQRQRAFGQSWVDVMRLAGRVVGSEVGANLEVIWTDPERKTTAQLADAALKAAQFGVPWEQRMHDYGYSPETIERMEAQLDGDAARNAKAAAATALAALAGPDVEAE